MVSDPFPAEGHPVQAVAQEEVDFAHDSFISASDWTFAAGPLPPAWSAAAEELTAATAWIGERGLPRHMVYRDPRRYTRSAFQSFQKFLLSFFFFFDCYA